MRTFFLAGLFLIASNVFSQATIEINNPSSLPREEEVISIPWQQVLAAWPAIDSSNFMVINAATQKQVVFQLELQGRSQVQNLLVQVTIPAAGKLVMQLKKGKPASFAAKTYCRFIQERKDDFAWENDRIAFRMYGKALESKPAEMAYGVDVWVKRTDRLVINERYKRAEYHVDHGDGMDYYHVGLTLGAGGNAPFLQDTIWYSKNYTGWKLLDNGPLRSTFQLSYDDWLVSSQKVNVTKTISLDAGSQLSRVEAAYTFHETPLLSIATGIIRRKEPGAELFDEQNRIMAYWEPEHGKDGTTGVGCLFMQPVQQMKMDKTHLLTITSIKQGEPLVYYSGAAWDKAGIITTPATWFAYLQNFRQKMDQPLQVKVKKASGLKSLNKSASLK